MARPNTAHENDEEEPLDPAAERVRRKLVRFMGINLAILFAAVMAVVLTLVYRSLAPAGGEGPSGTAAVSPVPPGGMLTGEIALPGGARILSHAVAGNRLTLHLRLADGGEAIHLYDLQEARLIGRFAVVREAP